MEEDSGSVRLVKLSVSPSCISFGNGSGKSLGISRDKSII